MTILIVSKNESDVKSINEQIEAVFPEASVVACQDTLEALGKARETEVDIAFIQVNMPELGGIDLGQYLKELNPFVNLIFINEDGSFGFEAMKLHASGYILSPAKSPDVKKEMTELRYPEFKNKQKRVFAQTFGNFELFIDGEPVAFKYSRTKEIVAILVNNRGAQTTNGEIIASLWEDDGDPEKKLSYLCNLRQDLQNTLKKYKAESIIIKQRGSMAIAKDKIECDLFDWLEKKKDSKYNYLGDYMNQYTWPEFVHAELDEISYQLYDEA